MAEDNKKSDEIMHCAGSKKMTRHQIEEMQRLPSRAILRRQMSEGSLEAA